MNVKIRIRLIASSILIALLFSQFSLCIAQQTTSDFVIGDKISFESKILNEKRIIVVIPPLNYKSHPDKKYPVVYVLDAGNNLFATHGIVSYYSKMLEIMPEMIIVGIVNKDRIRDFTPTAIKDYPNGGGADNFIQFIDSELSTYIDSVYPTSDYKCILGHSAGGLLAIYALQTKPNLFDSFLVIDPSLWWNDLQCVKSTKDFFEKNDKLKKRLFISLSNEKDVGVYPFLGELEKYAPNEFTWEFKHYKNETHNSLGHKSICDGFEMIFSDWGNEKE
jgi:predicted alpha/beta superfamily hydrolase